MQTRRLIYFVVAFVITSVVVFLSCKKDDSKNDSIVTSTVDQAKEAESQDAIADKIEQDIDNNIDKLEMNNFKINSSKSAFNGCVDITVDSVVTQFINPKTITLTFNCTDTVNGEKISQIGTIKVVVNIFKITDDGKLFKRTITFTNYKVGTDSASYTINGTRTVSRLSMNTSLSKDLKTAKLDIKDSIVSNLKFDVKYTNASVSFTRNVNHLRTSVLYFKRNLILWYADLKNDTVSLSGYVSGINAANINYTRQITTPLEFTFCPTWPHNPIIAKGEIDFSNSNGKVGTISYSANGCKTSATLNVNGKTKQIERRIGLGYLKWW
jgi:hypothetical protein